MASILETQNLLNNQDLKGKAKEAYDKSFPPIAQAPFINSFDASNKYSGSEEQSENRTLQDILSKQGQFKKMFPTDKAVPKPESGIATYTSSKRYVG